jgi:hypothetical protein
MQTEASEVALLTDLLLRLLNQVERRIGANEHDGVL